MLWQRGRRKYIPFPAAWYPPSSLTCLGLAQLDVVPAISSGSLKKVKITENGETTTYKEEDELAELAGGFGVLTLTECADYHVTDEELSAYGLDEASRITAEAACKMPSQGKRKHLPSTSAK